MAKTSTRTTPSFVCEVALVVSPANEGVMLARLEAARQMYNACLGQAMKRVRLIRQSKDFGRARSLKPSNPDRKVLFKRARELRSRRATNPDNYNPKGTVKKGHKKWNNSNTYLKIRSAKANLERMWAAWRTASENQPATGRILPSSFGRCPEAERVATKVFAKTSKNQDAVSVSREPGRGCLVKEPPSL